jgi:hypothetical protein
MKVSGQLQALAVYPKGKSPGYPLDRRLSGRQGRSGRCGEEKKYLHLRESNPIFPAFQPVSRRYTDWAIFPFINSVTCSPQANYTDRAAAAC